MLFKNLKLMR